MTPRPRDLALLQLAADAGPPRTRARDQQADLAGTALRRRVLERLAATDPEPDGLDEALADFVAELGEPSGPTRAVCVAFRDEWDAVRTSPGLWSWWIAEAVATSDDRDFRRSRRRRPPDGV